ncbi:hypothetical protein KUL42_34420 [Alteromonas sp. KUL42]|uniref:hypothetical protein n=1 Tax=Alteromonas sp. KUL42 TaxID=2480797 RepID=UPI001035EB35|nr:hypothetical protein [Alteromonas sp. KUL42]TAP32518.1 hypothetical protein EYR97_16995 [Alteromonas sp. KUL42]GEA08681.1 hypothetical protein KUL42_34420 [Alteromonas sp. KUL42]
MNNRRTVEFTFASPGNSGILNSADVIDTDLSTGELSVKHIDCNRLIKHFKNQGSMVLERKVLADSLASLGINAEQIAPTKEELLSAFTQTQAASVFLHLADRGCLSVATKDVLQVASESLKDSYGQITKEQLDKSWKELSKLFNVPKDRIKYSSIVVKEYTETQESETFNIDNVLTCAGFGLILNFIAQRISHSTKALGISLKLKDEDSGAYKSNQVYLSVEHLGDLNRFTFPTTNLGTRELMKIVKSLRNYQI